jgi:alpha-N-arabinofuranosidase
VDAGGPVASADVIVLHHADPLATNTADAPDTVTPASGRAEVEGATVTVELPPVSWCALKVTLN